MKYLIFLLIFNIDFYICDSFIVSTSSGPIRGKLVQSDYVDYLAFLGIPYAEPPVQILRFSPPVPKQQWKQILDTTEYGPVCPQPEGDYKYEQMDEDCLLLNIYVPNKLKGNLASVLFYVHGGEFTKLSGNGDILYGPQLFLQRDVVVVTVNYRLGVLGFLSLGIPEASGNAGIKDVILALQWVKTNIQRFGGDPDSITVAGNSAGAVLVHYLLLSTKTNGLFKQAILISGSAIAYRSLARHPYENALALCDELNINEDDTKELLENLRQADVWDIIESQSNMGKDNKRNGVRPYAPFVPCVEVNSSQAVITEDPKSILNSKLPQNVPVLAGFNSQEGIKMLGSVMKDPKLLEYINEDFELAIPSDIEYAYGSPRSKETANDIKSFYFNNNNITQSNMNGFVDFITDTQFFYATNSWINIYKENINSNILYYYMFDFDGELNWFKLKTNISWPGTSHADEEGYIFVTNATKNILPTVDAKTKTVMELMLEYWTNFIKYGNPNSYDSDLWKPTGNELFYLKLNENPQLINHNPRRKYYKFWSKIYNDYFAYINSGGEIEPKIVP